MKQEFEITQKEMDDIIEINKNNMPVLLIGNVTTGMDLQQRINAYWAGLGEKYGFKPMTVEPSAKGKLFILAEPCPSKEEMKKLWAKEHLDSFFAALHIALQEAGKLKTTEVCLTSIQKQAVTVASNHISEALKAIEPHI